MNDYFLKKAAWRYQANSSRRRGILFQISFEDWLNWWEKRLGPNWFEKRGKRRGQYCMARFGDKGPYKLGNIKCILSSKNSSEAILPLGGRSNLDVEVVKDIYQAAGCLAALSQKLKIGYHTIYDIKNDRCWTKVTNGLRKGKKCPCAAKGSRCERGYIRFLPKSISDM